MLLFLIYLNKILIKNEGITPLVENMLLEFKIIEAIKAFIV